MAVVREYPQTAVAAPAAEGAAVVDEGSFRAAGVATIAAGHWMHDSYSAFLAPLLVIFKQTLALSNTQAGLLSVFMQWPSLAQPLIGGLADHFSVRYFVILAPAVTGAMMSLLGVSPSYWTLAILLTIVGLSSACLHAVGPVMVGNLSGKKLGLGMSIWMVGGEAGRFVGPLVIGLAIPVLGMRRTPWLMLGGLLASAILLFTLKDDGHRARARDRQENSLRQELVGKGRLLGLLTGLIIVQVVLSAALVTYLPILLNDEGESFLVGQCFAIGAAGRGRGRRLGRWDVERPARTATDAVCGRAADFAVDVCVPGLHRLGALPFVAWPRFHLPVDHACGHGPGAGKLSQ